MHRIKMVSLSVTFFISLICMICLPRTIVVAADTQDTEETDWSTYLDQYQFSDINQTFQEEAGYSISFRQIIEDIIGDDGSSTTTSKGIVGTFLNQFKSFLNTNKVSVYQILMLAVLSTAIRYLGGAFGKNQVSDTAQMIISISLITILFAVFYVASDICADTISACINIYKSMIPVFFSVVALASGSTTSAVYYEIVLIMITVVNMVFGNILIGLNKIYVLFTMADSITNEEHFTKASELIPTIVKWTCRTAIVGFTGLAGIKGMVVPISDSMKKNLLYKALQLIPGVGNSVETVSQTVIGAGTVVKNGFGTAAIVVLILVCAVPICKLVILTCLFKVTAAAIEPISDKRLVKAVNSVSTAIGSLAVIALVSASLFILMAAVICLVTNMNYLA